MTKWCNWTICAGRYGRGYARPPTRRHKSRGAHRVGPAAGRPDPLGILIGTQDYEDKSLGRLEYPVADAKQLADVLVKRYRLPAEQAIVLADESRVRLEQGIPERLAKSGPTPS